MKNRKLLLIVSVVLAMTMSLGGTLAYLTDTDADVNTMVLGNVQIQQNEQERVKDADGKFTTDLQGFTDNQTMLPAVYGVVTGDTTKVPLTVGDYEISIRNFPNYMDKIVTVTNTGKTDAYVRTIIAVPAGINENDSDADDKVSNQWLHYNFVSDGDTEPANGWKYGTPANQIEYNDTYVGNHYYFEDVVLNNAKYDISIVTNVNVLGKDETTGPNLVGLYLDKGVDFNGTEYTAIGDDGKPVTVWNQPEMKVYVLSQAVQADGFADAWTAFENAFPLGKTEAEQKAKLVEWFTSIGVEGGIDIDTTGPDNVPPVFGTAVTPENISTIDFNKAGQTFELAGEFDAVTISDLGEGSVLKLNNASIGTLTLSDDAKITGKGSIESIEVVRNAADPIALTLDNAELDVTNGISVKNTSGKSILNITDSNIDFGTIFVGEHTANAPQAMAEFNVMRSFISGEENGLGSTVAIWGQSGVESKIYDSEIHTYSRGWHQSEDANDNAITFQGGADINVDIQRSNMHLYGARSIINARKYSNPNANIDFKIDESLIWVVTKSNHGEETLPVWGATEITDTMLLFTKNVHQSTPAVFKSFVYGNPTIHGDYHVTTQCQWDATIALADGQIVTFASDADVSIYDGAGTVKFEKTGSAQVVLKDGAQLKNITY